MKNLNIFLYIAIVIILLFIVFLIQEKRLELQAKELCKKNNLSYEDKIKEKSFALKAALCRTHCDNSFCKVQYYQIES